MFLVECNLQCGPVGYGFVYKTFKQLLHQNVEKLLLFACTRVKDSRWAGMRIAMFNEYSTERQFPWFLAKQLSIMMKVKRKNYKMNINKLFISLVDFINENYLHLPLKFQDRFRWCFFWKASEENSFFAVKDEKLRKVLTQWLENVFKSNQKSNIS